jgi:Protein of unknown function (DUF3037)
MSEVFEWALIRVVPRVERPGADVTAARAALTAFQRACADGPLAEFTLGERFRWLTAQRSAIVQPGPVHVGVTTNPETDLTRLFAALVTT